jgi:flagellar motor switch protein FliN
MWIVMNNGFLSQEEINSLLSGETSFEEPSIELTSKEKDMIAEIGKASMESAAKTLEMITGQPVTIASPVLSISSLTELKESIDLPYLALEVKYISGIEGINLLIHRAKDAQVIASLMMGGDGKVIGDELTEIDESAVSEAMNQMIGSSATTMSGILGRSINISPPISKVWKDNAAVLLDGIENDAKLIKVSYSMKIGDLVDSNIIQLLSFDTGKSIADIMASKEKKAEPAPAPAPQKQVQAQQPAQSATVSASASTSTPVQMPSYSAPQEYYNEPERPRQNIEVQQATFQPLNDGGSRSLPKNIDLILDVPLEISVVLGRTRKCIKDVLNLSTGSLIELDKLAEEPVEVLVNGKTVALAEVVVVGENFGVRITSIVSNTERLKTFSK